VATTRITFLRGFTRRFGNPFLGPVAGHLPWFCILHHVGRRSGRRYRTPLNVFRRGDSWVFALTYGSEVQWLHNVLAAGGCEIESRGRLVRLDSPEVVVDPSRRLVPPLVAFFLGLIRVTEFLVMHPSASPSDATRTGG
jgi:deazaflavin-dependent oxidoreductase (nitroreductase family)